VRQLHFERDSIGWDGEFERMMRGMFAVPAPPGAFSLLHRRAAWYNLFGSLKTVRESGEKPLLPPQL